LEHIHVVLMFRELHTGWAKNERLCFLTGFAKMCQ